MFNIRKREVKLSSTFYDTSAAGDTSTHASELGQDSLIGRSVRKHSALGTNRLHLRLGTPSTRAASRISTMRN